MFYFFFFNDTATTEIYTLSLHDALPICRRAARGGCRDVERDRRRRDGDLIDGVDLEVHRLRGRLCRGSAGRQEDTDRKSTRLNSSHSQISYAVFCLKKKKKHTNERQILQ